jgi:hypothetical protein
VRSASSARLRADTSRSSTGSLSRTPNRPSATSRSGTGSPRRGPSLPVVSAVQITRFGGPEVMDVVDLPDPVPGDGEQLFDISSSGVKFADTHHPLSR